MGFPTIRMRRLRNDATVRRLVRETSLSAEDFIYPLFVTYGKGVKTEIGSLPGQYRWSIDLVAEEAARAMEVGIRSVILFGIPETKDEVGSGAYDDEGIVQQAVRTLKSELPSLMVITDVCLDEFTSHGHCGLVSGAEILNDETLPLLAKTAVSHARAGADMVAPSDMMDGRVGVIRQALDEAGFRNTPIMAYSAKYASAFYGPFREAADSAPSFGDRRSYQMDPANAREALSEVALDLEEGADIVMVKPALAYLDIIRRIRDTVDVPVAAYNVSGEYAMIKAAAAKGWLDEKQVTLETLLSIKRAGADIILTYHAVDAAKWLKEQ